MFILGVAVQLWVLCGAELAVREAAVLTLDRDYVYDGVRPDIHAPFNLVLWMSLPSSGFSLIEEMSKSDGMRIARPPAKAGFHKFDSGYTEGWHVMTVTLRPLTCAAPWSSILPPPG